ncbi:hypothetical protein GE09DRAFT_1252782 [Coniochaeta sp. 2T2.1]|nr:hypothetical protein GE09DRAFT_1252782 [Coniochaeta sp. 2T2.1]
MPAPGSLCYALHRTGRPERYKTSGSIASEPTLSPHPHPHPHYHFHHHKNTHTHTHTHLTTQLNMASHNNKSSGQDDTHKPTNPEATTGTSPQANQVPSTTGPLNIPNRPTTPGLFPGSGYLTIRGMRGSQGTGSQRISSLSSSISNLMHCQASLFEALAQDAIEPDHHQQEFAEFPTTGTLRRGRDTSSRNNLHALFHGHAAVDGSPVSTAGAVGLMPTNNLVHRTRPSPEDMTATTAGRLASPDLDGAADAEQSAWPYTPGRPQATKDKATDSPKYHGRPDEPWQTPHNTNGTPEAFRSPPATVPERREQVQSLKSPGAWPSSPAPSSVAEEPERKGRVENDPSEAEVDITQPYESDIDLSESSPVGDDQDNNDDDDEGQEEYNSAESTKVAFSDANNNKDIASEAANTTADLDLASPSSGTWLSRPTLLAEIRALSLERDDLRRDRADTAAQLSQARERLAEQNEQIANQVYLISQQDAKIQRFEHEKNEAVWKEAADPSTRETIELLQGVNVSLQDDNDRLKKELEDTRERLPRRAYEQDQRAIELQGQNDKLKEEIAELSARQGEAGKGLAKVVRELVELKRKIKLVEEVMAAALKEKIAAEEKARLLQTEKDQLEARVEHLVSIVDGDKGGKGKAADDDHRESDIAELKRRLKQKEAERRSTLKDKLEADKKAEALEREKDELAAKLGPVQAAKGKPGKKTKGDDVVSVSTSSAPGETAAGTTEGAAPKTPAREKEDDDPEGIYNATPRERKGDKNGA